MEGEGCCCASCQGGGGGCLYTYKPPQPPAMGLSPVSTSLRRAAVTDDSASRSALLPQPLRRSLKPAALQGRIVCPGPAARWPKV